VRTQAQIAKNLSVSKGHGAVGLFLVLALLATCRRDDFHGERYYREQARVDRLEAEMLFALRLRDIERAQSSFRELCHSEQYPSWLAAETWVCAVHARNVDCTGLLFSPNVSVPAECLTLPGAFQR
jgi:hypothetical protein